MSGSVVEEHDNKMPISLRFPEDETYRNSILQGIAFLRLGELSRDFISLNHRISVLESNGK